VITIIIDYSISLKFKKNYTFNNELDSRLQITFGYIVLICLKAILFLISL